MSKSSLFHQTWTDGMYGQFVDELIAGSLADFAPCAGADVHRVSVSYQVGDDARALAKVEGNGDFAARCTVRQTGTVGFASSDVAGASSKRAFGHLRVPLITARAAKGRRPSSVSSSPGSSLSALSSTPAQVRFTDHARGTQLVNGLSYFLGLGRGASQGLSLGQLEVSGTLLPTVWTCERQAYGLRAGPLSMRLTALPYPPQLRMPDLETSHSSLMDETSQSALRRGKRPSYHYTLDAAACVPVPWRSPSSAKEERPLHPPLACTFAVQHPLLVGDSLVGLAIQSDRVESAARCAGIASVADPHDASRRVLRFPAVLGNAGGGERQTWMEAITYAEAEMSFRALLVQAVARKSLEVSDPAIAGTNASTLGADGLDYSIMRYDGAWTSLPTHVGLSASFYRNLYRVSLAGIFQEGTADVEAAAVVDMTPYMPLTPTLVKFGWNNLGRVAVGITSLFYDALAVTLGVHAMPGDGVRFGLHIAF